MVLHRRHIINLLSAESLGLKRYMMAVIYDDIKDASIISDGIILINVAINKYQVSLMHRRTK